MFKRIGFSLILVTCLAQPAGSPAAQAAAPVTQAGADRLATALRTGLSEWFPTAPDGPSYVWEGNLAVEPAGDAYAAQLPTLMVATDDAGAWVVDAVALRLVPTEDGAYRVSAQLPTDIPFVQPDGTVLHSASIGQQAITGVWRPEAEALTELSLTLTDILFDGAKMPLSTRLGTLDVFAQLAPDPTGRWSGPSTFRIDDLSIADANGRELSSLEQLSFEGEITGLDLAQQTALASAGGVASLEQRLGALRNLFNGASGVVTLSNLTAMSPAEDSSFGLKSLSAEIVLDGLVSNASTVSLGYQHTGLSLDPPATGEEFLPGHVAFRLKALDLPNAALWGALDRYLARREADVGPAAVVSLVQELMRSLTAAGSVLRFEEFTIDTPATTTHAEGYTRFSPTALLGATAEFDIDIRGLDQALDALQPKPGESLASEAQNTLALLGLLQVMGLPGQDEQGRPTRHYTIELKGNGSASLNGADLGSLLRSVQN